MAKRGKGTKRTNGSGRRERKPVGHDNGRRVSALRNRTTTTIPSNGNVPETHTEPVPEPVPIGEAMRQAVAKLGEIAIDESLAPSQLRQLGEAFEEVTKRKAAFEAKNEEAKTAKKSLEVATEALLLLVKDCTHPAPLPLFDSVAHEKDHADMLDAADDDSSDDDAIPGDEAHA